MIVNKLNNCAHLIVNFAKFFISGRPVIESQRRPTLAPQLSFLQKKRKQIIFFLVCENDLFGNTFVLNYLARAKQILGDRVGLEKCLLSVYK